MESGLARGEWHRLSSIVEAGSKSRFYEALVWDYLWLTLPHDISTPDFVFNARSIGRVLFLGTIFRVIEYRETLHTHFGLASKQW